jgi:UDP-N-acetylmuramate--alanine ligase
MKHAPKRIHFVGIGGAGMSGIAEVLLARGCAVSGSDDAASAATARLQALGARVAIGHAAGHLGDAQALVVSTAIRAHNPEWQAARAAGVPVVHRAVMLAELMRRRSGVAIAGTHGKTTTAALVTEVLRAAGADPGFVIGGTLAATGGNGHHGAGDVIVVEADESDGSFLHLDPVLAVVTNIDADHMDAYGQSLQRLRQSFADFIQRLPFYGAAAVCVDDPGVRAMLPMLESAPGDAALPGASTPVGGGPGRACRPLLRYGLGDDADWRARDVRALPGGRMAFVAHRPDAPPLPVELNLAGVHNVRNALAAIAVAAELEVPDAAVQRALAGFAGVGRRFQRHGDLPAPGGGRFTLVDDYGHHPTELAAVLAAARGAFPGRRLVLAFQPHRYTRTRDCFADFVRVLSQADAVVLTEVYAAGEFFIAGADGAAVAQALRAAAPGVESTFVPDVAALPDALRAAVRADDVLLTMGAGSIGAVPDQLRQACAAPGAAA